jgi:hypothetical protein
MTSIKGAVLAMGLCAAIGMIPNRSEAAVAVNIGFATPVAYGGHYETRHERVLVGGERHERRWVEPVYRTTCDVCGDAGRVQVRAGYWEEFCVPTRYEDRCVQVWIADPVCYETFGGRYGYGFGWGHRDFRHEYRR